MTEREKKLYEALKEARMMVAEWGEYASPYFQQKWGLADDLAKLDAVLGIPGIEQRTDLGREEADAERRFADQKITP